MSEHLDLIAISRERPVHFAGIGGAGMAPLAELLLRAGGAVSGCDSAANAATRQLERRGAEFHLGHDPEHVRGCGALVVTSALDPGHPERLAAEADGIPVLKRAAALGAVVGRGRVAAIAGTHGKTTTTAITATVLRAAGLDPTALVGGHVSDWDGNLLAGGDETYVVEADEYDRSFLTLHPEVAVVTTLEADHLDIYGTLEAVEDAFATFLGQVSPDGTVLGCADDRGVARLLPRVGGRRTVSYGLSAGAMLRAEDVISEGAELRFRVLEEGVALGTARTRLAGMHNVRNALAAVGVARHFGADWDDIADGLASFGGVARRFEHVGEAGGVVVYDDYAHHPTEVEATLRAARERFPERRLVAAFQPHLFSRTRDFADAFGRALALADQVLVADVYAAREAPIPGVSGELVARGAREAGATVTYESERARVSTTLHGLLREGDVCFTLGAGDLDGAAREVLELLGGGAR
jgi:UDP-N-acetylmuramate--alanine ligase